MATPARSYRRYRQIVTLYPVVLLVYLGIAWSDWWWPGRAFHEVFPFFSWDLFSSPRQDGRLYTVRVTRVTDDHQPAAALLGRTLADPRAEHFLRDPRFQKTTRSLARAHWTNLLVIYVELFALITVFRPELRPAPRPVGESGPRPA